MNSVQLIGRFTRDPEVRYANNGTAIAKWRMAVDRKFKRDGEPDADFISCVAFGKTAEFVEKFFHKGMRIGVVGRIQTGSYTNNDGNKVYTTDVVAENVEFCESKQQGQNGQQDSSNDFVNVPDGIDDDLPFN